MTPRTSRPRLLHPAAWWCWALCVGVAASRTTNPWLLGLLAALLGWTVAQRREPGTGRILAAFLLMGALAIVLRVGATALGGARLGAHLLVELPVVPLPAWLGGLRLGGAVHLEPLLRALYDGAQLAVVLGSVGAANALAGPRRLLRYVPATLYDVGTALVVGLTYAPRLVTEAQRLARARRLRGHRGRGVRETGRLVVPVVSAALDGALGLAASMECRGYGRTVTSRQRQLLASGLAMLGLGGVVVGVYGLLDGFTPVAVGLPVLVLGILVAAATLWFGAGRDPRTRYRRDPFARPEWVTIACGVTVAVAFGGWGALDPTGMRPPTMPLTVPDLPLVPVLALVVVALPGALTPEPPVESAASSVPAAPARGADDGDLTPHALAPALARGRAADRARVGDQDRVGDRDRAGDLSRLRQPTAGVPALRPAP
ncbi:MAG: energy-coupling factor transporter transmembrane protein EcfT [Austwickia sp.]|nr:MAG: energy-coupling factor transporter transmembrane protein EcfT [Austwickia sp.]